MGAGYLIDSNVIIEYLDRTLPDTGMRIVGNIIDEIPKISVINKIEILRFNTTDAAYNTLENFIQDCSVLNLNDEIIDKTIAICKSNKIKLPDAIVAATALTYDLTLVTINIVDFKNIKRLKLYDPTKISAKHDPLQDL